MNSVLSCDFAIANIFCVQPHCHDLSLVLDDNLRFKNQLCEKSTNIETQLPIHVECHVGPKH